MSMFTSFLNLFKWDLSSAEDKASAFDIDTALNDNWDKIDEAVEELDTKKVAKEEGKGLSTNDYTNAEKEKVAGIATGAQVNILEGLTRDGTNLQVQNKNIEIKDPEVTNARTSTKKDKTFASVDARLEEIEEDISNIDTTRGHVYGIKRKISNNSSSAWERTDDAVGLVANATKNGGAVVNDFDNLSPWKDIISYNLDLTTKKVKAFYGDADFKFDGTNGDVYTRFPDVYYKIWQENDYDYIQIADYARAGFKKCNSFDIQRYITGQVDNQLRSYSGLVPAYNKTLPAFRTAAKALGDEFCLLDWRYFIIQILYLVEYADYNTQAKLGNGMSNMRFNNSDVALIAESNTNRIVINTSGGNAFYVGQTISIGTSGRENFGVAANRIVTAINDYNEDGIVGKEIIFDGAPVTTALTNVIWSSGQHSGGCDGLGMKSGCYIDDSKHAVIYRGVENWFGNIFQWVDGINIQDYQAY